MWGCNYLSKPELEAREWLSKPTPLHYVGLITYACSTLDAGFSHIVSAEEIPGDTDIDFTDNYTILLH